MNVNFEYYKIFYYVAKYGSFTKAARALGSTQPNVTRAMNCLEQQLHNTLFIRTNRGIQLTPEGEQLYTHVSVAMAQLFIAEEELSDSASLTHGSVTIGATETALNIFLLCKLKAFRTAYPGIRLKIYNYSSPQAIAAVKSGKIDFAVLSTLFLRNRHCTLLRCSPSGDPYRWTFFFRSFRKGTLFFRFEEISFHLPGERNCHFSVL